MYTRLMRLASARKKACQAIERRLNAGLAPTREEQAIRIALKHIAEGAIEPYSRWQSARDRNRGMPQGKYGGAYRAANAVTEALYRHAFYECLRARKQGRAPIWANLDLVDSPLLVPQVRKHKQNRMGEYLDPDMNYRTVNPVPALNPLERSQYFQRWEAKRHAELDRLEKREADWARIATELARQHLSQGLTRPKTQPASS